MDQQNTNGMPNQAPPPVQPQGGYAPPPQQGYQPPQGYAPQPEYAAPPQMDPDAMKHKALAMLCYLSPLMGMYALVAAGTSPYVRYHANQGMSLDVMYLLSCLLIIIPILGWIVFGIGMIVMLVFRIMGILNAKNGRKKELPMCGKWNIVPQ